MSRASRLLLLFGDGGGISPQQAYINKVVALSPIAYWPLDDTSGSTARDASGNGRTGTYSNVTLNAVGPVSGGAAASFNGSTSFVNVYSASLAAAFNGAEGSLMVWGIVSAAGVWTNGAEGRLVTLSADASNRVLISKSATDNTLTFQYSAGGVAKTVNHTFSSTAYFYAALTWSKSNDRARCYVAGAQVGATQTSLGTFAGSLAATLSVIGAQNTTPTGVFSGTEAHVAVWSRELSAAEVLSLATP
jgi:hypothetical protein